VFAEVEIQVNDAFPPIDSGPGKFHIAFTAKSAKWTYYLITDRT